MNGPEHYLEGDKLMADIAEAARAVRAGGEVWLTPEVIANMIAGAQVHYTAALAAATAEARGLHWDQALT
jgi:hypothetical protein